MAEQTNKLKSQGRPYTSEKPQGRPVLPEQGKGDGKARTAGVKPAPGAPPPQAN